MNASSESGLWARWTVRFTGHPLLFTTLGFLPELLHHRLVVHILQPVGRHFSLIMAKKILLGTTLCPSIILDSGRSTSDEIPEQMTRCLGQDGVRQGSGLRETAHLQMNDRSVIAGVGIHGVQLLVGTQSHGSESLNLVRLSPFSGLHDPIEQPVEPFPRAHPTDVGRPLRLPRTRICHVGSGRLGGRAGHFVRDPSHQDHAEGTGHERGSPIRGLRGPSAYRRATPVTEARLGRELGATGWTRTGAEACSAPTAEISRCLSTANRAGGG